MECTFGCQNITLIRSTSDMWHAIKLHCSEQSFNRSPWEKDHKSQMVKPIMMKPVVEDQGQARLPQCEMSDTEDQ